jgi:hypothetical protein
MTMKRWIVPIVGLVIAAAVGCSSSDSGSPEDIDPGTSEERRTPIGKADSLSGKCIDGDKNHCGGKSKGKCWCDAACVQFGDCCSDVKPSCGGSASCESNADCAAGQYCNAEPGCGTFGTCTKLPVGQVCTAVITTYCGCDGVTRQSTSGCINDRYAHTGACKSETCGGIAGLPCPDGKICVVDPNNDCADCPGICVVQPACPDVMCTLFCENGFKKDENGCDVCSCADSGSGASCEGACGGPASDKSCYCDSQCEKYKDCCADYATQCEGERTPASGQCVRNSDESCTTDADCAVGGCGGELCYNPSFGGGISTCDCAGPGAPVTGCGCVAGKCTWYN